jgi:hypothetical protein
MRSYSLLHRNLLNLRQRWISSLEAPMPRPISWLPRLHEIRRSVVNSVRSHYDRNDLERLFEVQPRSAQLLLELLPTVRLGRSLLAEREALVYFLERLTAADDVSGEIERIRSEKRGQVRRKLRYVVTDEVANATVFSLPSNVAVEPGRLEIRFNTLVELAESLHAVAQALDHDLDTCAQLWVQQATGGRLDV